MNRLSALVAGLIFGAGLSLSGMTDSNQVLAFLNLAGAWNPNLILVMGSAVLVTGVGYFLVQKRAAPLFANEFLIPAKTHIDQRLILGATIFGGGWGLVGFCPGPALVAAMMLDANAVIFLVAFVVGLYIFEYVDAEMHSEGNLAADG